MNVVILMGRLTDNPELKYTQSNTAVTSFSIAVQRNYTTDSGEKPVDFINCVAWRKTAEFISKYFAKGEMIAISGSVQTRKYQDKNGNNRIATEVVCDNAYFCGAKAMSTPQTNIDEKPDIVDRMSAVYGNRPSEDFEEIGEQEDLPF